MRLPHRCFPWNFVQNVIFVQSVNFRTPFFIEHPQWLLFTIQIKINELTNYQEVKISVFFLKKDKERVVMLIDRSKYTKKCLELVQVNYKYGQNIWENPSFHVKKRSTGKVQFLFSRRLLLVLTKFSIWEGDWALGYYSIKFWHYSELS